MSTTTDKKSTAKVIKPLKPTEFNPESVVYSSLNVNNEAGSKWVNTTYDRPEDKNKQFLVVVKNCKIISYKKLEAKTKADKPAAAVQKEGSKPRKDKYQLFVNLKDMQFIEFLEKYEDNLVEVAQKNSKQWFGCEMSIEDGIKNMLRKATSKHETYGYSLSSMLSNDCTCDSKVEEVTDCSNLDTVLIKNTIVNLVFNLNKVKINTEDYRIGSEIKHISIIEVGVDTPYVSNALTPEKYEKGKLTLTGKETNDNGGKFCKVQYDSKLLRIKFTDIIGRIFKNEDPEGKISFSLSIRLVDPTYRDMIKSIDEEIFEQIYKNSKEYYGIAKTKKQLNLSYKNICSYNKTDKEKIDKGEKPQYDPSIWIKLYHSVEKGFDKKIINSADKKPLDNVDDLINKDLNITEIEAYSRHVWFGTKGTSVNFTLNRCEISYDVPEYKFDDVDESSNKDEEEVEDGEKDAENSSNDDE
jgi:hypothetical protein